MFCYLLIKWKLKFYTIEIDFFKRAGKIKIFIILFSVKARGLYKYKNLLHLFCKFLANDNRSNHLIQKYFQILNYALHPAKIRCVINTDY